MKIKLVVISVFFLSFFSGYSQVTEPDMIFVKGATFYMGKNDGDDDEKPAHKVALKDYYISRYEITVKQYREFCEMTDRPFPAAPSHTRDPRTGEDWYYEHDNVKDWVWKDNYPIVNVSWNDAKAYCDWLADFTGRKYRLPTEAEWEFAARGGVKSKGYDYSGSNDASEVAWYDETTDESGLRPVGTKKPNELGIYDMSGNAWEWCADYYAPDYYSQSPKNNPQGPETGLFRVIRGGSWYYGEWMCRVYTRDGPRPMEKNWNYGFRVVLSN